MKKTLTRRIPAVAIAVTMLFVTIFSMTVVAGALTFTPRYTMPDYDNKYYYSDLNPFYPAGYGLPNCTAYAFGRVYEITGQRPNLSTGNAENWYPYNQSMGYYEYGQTPRLGAIACWSYGGGGGHVAVVESIDSDGNMILSNSAWSARYGSCEPFYLTYAHVSDSNPGGSSWWYFQGYIYAVDSAEYKPGSDIEIETSEEIYTTPGKTYDAGMYQVVADPYLNMRTGAGTSYSFVTKVPDGVKIKVTATKKDKNGNTWGETSYDGWDGWVSLNYCRYLGDIAEYPTEAPTEAPTTVAPTTEPKEIPTEAPTQPATKGYDAEIPTEEPTEKPTKPVKPTEAPTVPVETTVPEVPTEKPTAAPEKKFPKGLGTGDVNGDGRIDISDATCIQQIVAKMGSYTADQIKWADFDFDGFVTVSDATRLQKYVSGIYF